MEKKSFVKNPKWHFSSFYVKQGETLKDKEPFISLIFCNYRKPEEVVS
jgi:hypothetical protein